MDNFKINLTLTEFRGRVPEIARITLIASSVCRAGSEYELIMNCLEISKTDNIINILFGHRKILIFEFIFKQR